MPTYTAPLRDMRFVMHELLAEQGVLDLPGSEELEPELVDEILAEAGKLCAGVLAPLNRSGDEAGCRYDNGEVRTPPGFKDAYDQYVEAGWPALAGSPDHGGQGLPALVDLMVTEMMCSSNLAFSMYPSLTHGAYKVLEVHGSEALKARWLEPMVAGRFTGTMCLTEPQCGTDLGLVRTRAVAAEDGSWRVSGEKIFISAGEHDLAENIVHLVLARTPDAPAGTRGLSLFLVPKRLLDDAGRPGARNGVLCTRIEEKMGIHGSATCALSFDESVGYLVGELHRGMPAMFLMMNSARLVVGVHGLAVGEAAYQGAVAYARERRQGRALAGAREPGEAADPIVVHPDVRRMLLTMRAQIEGCRALAAWVATELDIARRHPDAGRRQEADDLVALLTPVVKGYCTDVGSEVASIGVQVLGGHGYIREHGMEQLVRDARICQIYEGTNGVQAMDLVGRKLGTAGGRLLRRLFHPIAAFLEARADRPEAVPLAKAFGRLQRATATIAARGLRDPNEAGAVATDYLRLMGLVVLGYLWTRMSEVAGARLGDDPGGFYQAKVDTARFFLERILPETSGLAASIMAGGASTMALDEDAFTRD
ncbi:MAG: acyl-CoA dehydrogenase C-terminal domain-containing protein [Ectothiorhodospiraceae bacterium]|nr:acyl-CoA dehydrogenase C-terminal domain-containing protein [Ectothiorhodospiraceae bacterium]